MVRVPKRAMAKSLFLRTHWEVELNRFVGLKKEDEEVVRGRVAGCGGLGR